MAPARHQHTPPDLTPPRVAADQTLVDVLYSQSQQERAIIISDAHGNHRIRTEYWCTDERGAAFWCVPSRYTTATLTDTAERARELARERLHDLVHNIPKH